MRLVFFITFISLVFANNLFPESFVTLSEVKRGQKGTGVTRWSDNRVKKFEVEILGVLKSSPKSGVVIARINDNEISNTGVVAGMSGSPVYIDGKLVGAIAFTWTFLKEPIVGITPIEEMLPLEKYLHSSFVLPNDVKYVTPILLSGVSPLTRWYLETKLGKKNENILLIDSFSSFSVDDTSDFIGFSPGDGIGVNLVSGDMEITVMGTVTHVSGNKVFGLGHPAFLSGRVSIPISDLEIITVVPRQNLSFKIGVPKRIVGSMDFDGNSGIFCTLGKRASTIKVSINVDKKNLYNYSIVKEPNLAPLLLSAVATESILRTRGLGGEGNVELRCSVSFRFEGLDQVFNLDFKDIIPAYQVGYGYALSLVDVTSILDFLVHNPIFKADVEKVHIDIDTKPIDVGFIIFVVPSKTVVSPGEEVKINVGIKKFRDEIVLREFKVRIPTWVSSGTRVNIGAMNRASRTIQKISSYPETVSFDTYEKLYNFISEELRVEKLVLYVEIPSAGYASGGYVYNLLPNYLSTTFTLAPKAKNIVPFIIEEETLEAFPIGGIATSSIFVK